ncbi:MAG: ABC transporter ATP-binding protein [Alphaproteobacteria bacterium]
MIKVSALQTRFGAQIIHRDVGFTIPAGKIIGVVGGSGTGKSVLLRKIIGLMPSPEGNIELFGQNLAADGYRPLSLKRRFGVLFQEGALISSLSVGDNIALPLREATNWPDDIIEQITIMKLLMVGLPAETHLKFPAMLSGGMRKRVGLARAMALDPELLFLDEPTAGLDPIAARHFDELTLELRRNLGLSVMMITHDLDSLVAICDEIIALVDGEAIMGTLEELKDNPNPWCQEYFHQKRG